MQYELTEKQSYAFNSLKNGHNVFLTGPAGSGKTYLLKIFIEWFIKYRENDNEKIYITSTTGLSALLIDGMTINRYSGIGTGDKSVEDYFKKIMKMTHIKKRWLSTKVLIIDEISMMNPDTFDKLEILAQKIRKNSSPFGGIQLILSGDFLQLPPINCQNFCFDSFSWQFVIHKTIYFDKIVRQHDTKLQNILNNIRIGIVNDDVKEILNNCLNKDLSNSDGIIPTLLYSRKNMVYEYNILELNKLINDFNKEHYCYQSYFEFGKNIKEESKDFLKDLLNSQYQVEDSIKLSVQTQVMLTVNMPEVGLANGSRGIIVGFSSNNFPIVLFMNNQKLEITFHEYLLDEGGQTVKKFQIPLIYAWAITIHKAQGMTLEFLKTDIGSSIFEYGQAYVVLSRIKNLDGLSLINIDYSKIKAHPKILKYYEELAS
jgi:ATP-dependent DNA helicase PIF1